MEIARSNNVINLFYRCAGPNCGILKRSSDRWWLMWTSFGEYDRPVLFLCPWDEEIASRGYATHLWRAVRAEAAIAVHGQREGE